MGRENRPLFAWYGDMELVPHLWEALLAGPLDVVVQFHAPLSLDDDGPQGTGSRAAPDSQAGVPALARPAAPCAGRARALKSLRPPQARDKPPPDEEALRQDLWLPDERL